MADRKLERGFVVSQLLTRTMLSTPIVLAVFTAQQAQAQQRLVSACSGVSLPPSEPARWVGLMICASTAFVNLK